MLRAVLGYDISYRSKSTNKDYLVRTRIIIPYIQSQSPHFFGT